jgi:hypothetical protein
MQYDDEDWQERLFQDWEERLWEEESDDDIPPEAKFIPATGDTKHPSSSVPAVSEAVPSTTKRPQYTKVIREPGDIPSVRGNEGHKTEWLIEGHIVECGIHLVSGQPGCMKTLKAQNEARAISAGLEIYGTKARQRLCVYLDRENPLQLVQERFELLGVEDESNLRYWGMWNSDQPPMLDTSERLRLLEWAKAYKPVIFIDPLNAFHSKDENSATHMREVTTFIKQLRFAGATVVILHHQGKLGVEGPRSPFRGSSELSAACDIGYLVEKKEDGENPIVTVSSFKNRMGLPIKHSLRFDAKSGLFIPLDAKQSPEKGTAGQAETNAIAKAITENPGADFEKIKTVTGIGDHKLRDLLKAPSGLWEIRTGAHGKQRYFPVAASS